MRTVFAQWTDGLAWSSRWHSRVPPSKSGIFQARVRLGFEAVEALFRRVAAPLATAATPGAWLGGRRLVAIDGCCLDVADTPENAVFFGRPGVSKGEKAAFPQARVVAVAECGTHAVFDAVVGSYGTAKVVLARELIGRVRPGMLLLADRGFYGFGLWKAAVATGADLLWRMRSSQRLDPIEILADGSYLSQVFEVHNYKRRGDGLIVRVIDDGRPNENRYQLITTILDPDDASATDLAIAYGQRWEIEGVLDELKTHQRGPRAVLRSKSPDLVLQEIWGYLCCHYAIRTLMWEAAAHTGTDPDRVSFVAALRISRRPAADEPTPESSNAKCPNGTSNALTTPTGPNPPTNPKPRSETLN